MPDFSKKILRTDSEWPVRLNRFLSDCGFCSRREADRLIEAGKVTVDGRIAVLGQKVYEGQTVTACGKEVKTEDRLILLAFNKPMGIECTADKENPDNIVDYIGYPSRIYPVGRLDKQSHGLILLTNTGDLVNSILKGSNYHEKEYVVRIDRPVTDDFLKEMSAGCVLSEKEIARPCRVEKLSCDTFKIILTQGLNRQIRRMCSHFGAEVVDLKRTRIMNIELKGIEEGKYRELSGNEFKGLLEGLGYE